MWDSRLQIQFCAAVSPICNFATTILPGLAFDGWHRRQFCRTIGHTSLVVVLSMSGPGYWVCCIEMCSVSQGTTQFSSGVADCCLLCQPRCLFSAPFSELDWLVWYFLGGVGGFWNNDYCGLLWLYMSLGGSNEMLNKVGVVGVERLQVFTLLVGPRFWFWFWFCGVACVISGFTFLYYPFWAHGPWDTGFLVFSNQLPCVCVCVDSPPPLSEHGHTMFQQSCHLLLC